LYPYPVGVMIDVREVSKAFGPNRVLDRVSVAIPAGRTTVLLGPSGGGKSTLLRVMNGLVRPDAGEVRFDGRPLTPADSRTARHRMGYVVQEGGLFPHLTAAGNVSLLASHLGWDRDRIRARLKELADLARLPADLLDRYPAELSGGQKQRVAVARALISGPEVLFADEPTGALDTSTSRQVMGLLRHATESAGQTVVMVTHDPSVAAYADVVVFLEDGLVAGSLRGANASEIAATMSEMEN
jgi:osmoprotectant transport system ATP-binding protein